MGLHEEILEQPAAMRRLLATGKAVAEAVGAAAHRRGFDFVYVIARGSSDNAGLYAKYLFGIENRIATALAAPSMFTAYGAPPRLDRALVIGISQSGRSPDIIQAMTEARRQGAVTVVVTNVAASPLAEAAEFVLDIAAGPETSVAATKSYTGQMLGCALLSIALAGDSLRAAALERLPELAAETLGLSKDIASIAERYRSLESCVVLGRGYNYATAFEWSLKLKELCYAAAMPYSSADFRHGPIALVRRGFPVFAVVADGAVAGDMMAAIETLRTKHEAEILVISDREDARRAAHRSLALPRAPEWISPLLAILPAQLFTYHLTKARGQDTEKPRGLSKITETL